MENENKTAQPLTEEQLAEAAGGDLGDYFPVTDLTERCHFTWTGKERNDADGSIWLECASRATTCPWCVCHWKAQCVGRWHRIHSGQGDQRRWLEPINKYNHNSKRPENNYNT